MIYIYHIYKNLPSIVGGLSQLFLEEGTFQTNQAASLAESFFLHPKEKSIPTSRQPSRHEGSHPRNARLQEILASEPRTFVLLVYCGCHPAKIHGCISCHEYENTILLCLLCWGKMS